MSFRTLCKILLALLLGATASAASASQGSGMLAAPADLEHCAALNRSNFAAIPEAPTQITSVQIAAASGDAPTHCLIKGVVVPNVGFYLRLPGVWNGKLFMAGCGNWCGTIYPHACDDPLRRGYACVQTDAGHVARPEDVNWTDGQWAYNNLQAELDYGGRASHVAALAGKAITREFYGRSPEHSYFWGCSYGGHQSMVLAQRFPYDFDGIIGGGVPNNLGKLMQQNLWALANAYRDLKPVFSEADISVLHTDVLRRCDRDDGVMDGLLSNPIACRVDPARLVCKPGQASGCISREIAIAASRMYSGPMDSRGRLTSAGGWAPGSEVFWRRVYRPDGTGLAALAPNYLRYMGRVPDLGPGWKPESYDFDEDYKRNDVMEAVYAAANPDLRRFKAAGGKFINYVGWSDLGTIPAEAIDYYETATRTMGGRTETLDFFRMFMIPGALHCRGGEGPDKVDFLSYIERWVEGGNAPDMMIGAHADDNGQVKFTRPLYPYPQYATYTGRGDPNDAKNFTPTTTKK